MAKKKRKSTRRRSRRIGAAKSGFDFMSPLLAAVGGAGGGFLNKVIPTTVNPKLAAGGKIVVGALLPMISKDQKTKAMLTALGHGLIGVGTVDLLQSFGMISGYAGAATDIDENYDLAVEIPRGRISDDVLNGDDVRVINDDVLNENPYDLSVVNGEQDDDLLMDN